MYIKKRFTSLTIALVLLASLALPFGRTMTAQAAYGDNDHTFALKVTEARISVMSDAYHEPYQDALAQGVGYAFSGYQSSRNFVTVGPYSSIRLKFYVDSSVNGIAGNGMPIDQSLIKGGSGFNAGGLWFSYEKCDVETDSRVSDYGKYYIEFQWRPTPGEPQTNRLIQLSRDVIELSSNGILTSIWDDRLPPGTGGSKMTAYRLFRLDMRSAIVNDDIFAQMSPIRFTLTPNLADLKDSKGGATGLGFTQVFLDIDTDFLLTKNWTGNSAYFYRYDFGGVSLQSKPWIKAEDRNALEIPADLRNKPINLWLEVCDIVGNRYVYANGFAAKGSAGVCKPSYNTCSLLAGDRDMFTYITPDSETAWPPTPQERAQAFNNAAQEYAEYGNTPASMRYYFKFLSVFIGIQNIRGVSNGVSYTGTRSDIDIQMSGYQWARNSQQPDYGEPYIPWDRYYPADELGNTGADMSGYRCVIEQYPEETGDWYLWLFAVDKQSGGTYWRKAETTREGKFTDFVYKVAGTPPTVKFEDITVIDCDKPVISFQFESDFGLGCCAYQICPTPNICNGYWHPEVFGEDNGFDVGGVAPTYYVKVPFGAKSHTVSIDVTDIDFSTLNASGMSFSNIVIHAKAMDCREYNDSWLNDSYLKSLFNSPAYGYRNIYFGMAPQFIPIEDQYRTITYQSHTVVSPVQPYYSVGDDTFPYQYFPRVIYAGQVTRGGAFPNNDITRIGPVLSADLFVSLGGSDGFTGGVVPFKPNVYYSVDNVNKKTPWTLAPENGKLTIRDNGTNTVRFKVAMTPEGNAMGAIITLNVVISGPNDNSQNAVVTYDGLNRYNVKMYPKSGSPGEFYYGQPLAYNDQPPTATAATDLTMIAAPDFDQTFMFGGDYAGGSVNSNYRLYKEFYTRFPLSTDWGRASNIKFSVVDYPERFVATPPTQRVTTGKIVYSSTEPGTTRAVTAYMYVGLPTAPFPGVTYRGGWVSHTFDGNGSFIFDVTYADNGMRVVDYLGGSAAAVTAVVNWMALDRTAPVCPVTYEYEYDKDNSRYIRDADGYTNRPITAKLNLPSPNPSDLKIINNFGSDTVKFLENGSFTFEVMDKFGSTYNYRAEVTQINRKPPTLTLVGAEELYSFYKGIDFESSEPGYSATDWLGRNITGSVVVENNIDPYIGGYQTIKYTATDSVGNSTTEYRAACVFDLKNIELLVNGVRLSQQPGMSMPRGSIKIQGIGNESPYYVIKYLEGDHKVGEFKEEGIVVKEMDAPNKPVTVNLTKAGLYSIYIRDYEGNTFVGQINVQ